MLSYNKLTKNPFNKYDLPAETIQHMYRRYELKTLKLTPQLLFSNRIYNNITNQTIIDNIIMQQVNREYEKMIIEHHTCRD